MERFNSYVFGLFVSFWSIFLTAFLLGIMLPIPIMILMGALGGTVVGYVDGKQSKQIENPYAINWQQVADWEHECDLLPVHDDKSLPYCQTCSPKPAFTGLVNFASVVDGETRPKEIGSHDAYNCTCIECIVWRKRVYGLSDRQYSNLMILPENTNVQVLPRYQTEQMSKRDFAPTVTFAANGQTHTVAYPEQRLDNITKSLQRRLDDMPRTVDGNYICNDRDIEDMRKDVEFAAALKEAIELDRRTSIFSQNLEALAFDGRPITINTGFG